MYREFFRVQIIKYLLYLHIGGTSESKLGVAGDSAGGYIAAVVCHEAYKLVNFSVCTV